MKTLMIEDLTMKEKMDRNDMLAVRGGIIGGCVAAPVTVATIILQVHDIAYGTSPTSCLTNLGKGHGFIN